MDEGPSNEAGILAMKIFAEVNGTVPIQQLQELAASGLLEKVPRTESGELASVGSIYHQTGTCAPCTYWFKSSCKYSIGCRYCHFLHPGQTSKRMRPSKQTRMRYRRRKAQEAELALNNDGSSNDGALNNDGSSNDGKGTSNGKASSSTDEGKDSSNGSSGNGSGSYGKSSSSADKGKESSGNGTPPGSTTADRQSTTDDTYTYDDTPPGSSGAGSPTREVSKSQVTKNGVGRGERHFTAEG